MDYSNLYLTIGYTLVIIIATFSLREKYPDRYSIGCILCFLAPAWGQFYKNKRSSLYIWFFLMAIERGVSKGIGDDWQEQLTAWVIIGGMSSIGMYFRLRADKKDSVVDKKITTQNIGDNLTPIDSVIQGTSSENIPSQYNSSNLKRIISYETGISRIGIIIGIATAVALSVLIINDTVSDDFVKNKILLPSVIVSLSVTTGLLIWGVVVLLYRVFMWVKYGFSDTVSYTVANIYKINNKIWPIICVLMVLLTGIQAYFLKKANDNRAITYAPTPAFNVDPCAPYRWEADKLKTEIEKLKQIYGRYPRDLDGIHLTLVFPNSIHVQKLTANSYKISLTGNDCNSIYTIESNKNDVAIQNIR